MITIELLFYKKLFVICILIDSSKFRDEFYVSILCSFKNYKSKINIFVSHINIIYYNSTIHFKTQTHSSHFNYFAFIIYLLITLYFISFLIILFLNRLELYIWDTNIDYIDIYSLAAMIKNRSKPCKKTMTSFFDNWKIIISQLGSFVIASNVFSNV